MDSLLSMPLEGFSLFSHGHAFQAAASSALAGVVFHLTLPQLTDIEFFMYKLIATFTLALFGLGTALFLNGFSLFDTFTRVSILTLGFYGGLFTSMGIYRVFFHRLRNFPGPLDLKISRFFSARRAATSVQYHKVVAEMHEKYGDFIRTGPREICIVRGSAPQLIYGTNSKCLKSTFYGQTDYDSKKCHIVGATDFDDHRRRRRAWDKGVSSKALQMYAPRTKVLVDKFVSQISQQTGPVDARDWSMYLAFDIIGELGFGKSFGCVETGQDHPAITAIHDHMEFLGVFEHVPWLLNMLSRLPSTGFAPFYQYVYSLLQLTHNDYTPEKAPQTIMSWLYKAVIEKDISASPTTKSLEEDCRAVIIAGSDTNGITLANTLFYLIKNPHVMKKLQAKIDAAIPTPEDWTYEKVKSITYINNILDEVLRLKPAVLVGGYRVTPPEGIYVDEQYIPGKTHVFVPTQRIQTDPRFWTQAGEFVPERWGERYEEMGTAGSPYMPFSLGPYMCAGKSLAIMNLSIGLCSIAQNFDIEFAPGETGEIFDTEVKDTFTTGLPPLKLLFTPRKK
ncbi:putative benzoate 4-monooxygenase cytochrome P450 [Annulohypoxylon maeteangense]|uniref:putative benzoate 4-monooxygenase cytochrome P450 n=1 Tax=Annulohypoxylon maeteangense TaxID=1927788 RepID=UPI00200824B7|nr:putative benzoate 4-monooxygenase cytochrome P450 [Annulohypoxylon maeteangense]KAI0883093.1 putative benzoate 4-monooxygenase cytochrome P450 [Annulohypoxylon maeteangense]